MRKVIVFFNGEPPYLLEVSKGLPTLRLSYPDGQMKDLQISRLAGVDTYAFATDRDVEPHEVREAAESLIQ
ncbi:hypothetical protein [Serratia sp. PL7]|uniref:hypothetical protein n=1 Tax=Serratia sp. PL7 TaxID=2952201 RepID=UPI001A0ED6CD|nr:hypothetical protein [Serratia sp. PL7]MBE0153409.1 hypothetical protein [Serratia fonticola]